MTNKEKDKIELRCTTKEKNYWKIKARLYFKGNMSEFIRYCLDNYDLAERFKGMKNGDK